MTDEHIEKQTETDSCKKDGTEIDLMEIIRDIVRMRKTLYKALAIGLIIGVIVGLSIPKKYTVNVTLSPEMGNSRGNNALSGLAASFLGGNASTGDNSDALNAALSGDIVSSTPFLLELANIKVSLGSGKKEITLGDYLDKQSTPWWSYITGLPGAAIGGIKSLFGKKDNVQDESQTGPIKLTGEENRYVSYLRGNVIALMDNKTAITKISVTLQNPQIAAVLADSVIYKLQESIIGYRTSKAKDDCIYLEKLFKERQSEYYIAQKKYAQYVDTHDNLILQSVRAEQDRLQNDMNLAYQVYSQVANQLQVARAKVQEEKPVYAVVEPAVVPTSPSGMKLKTYVLLFMFLSLFGTIGWMLFGKKLYYSLKENL